MLLVVQSSYCSVASQSSNPRVDFDKALELVKEHRDDLLNLSFPYMNVQSKPTRKESIDDMFDELEHIIDQENAKKESAAAKQEDNH